MTASPSSSSSARLRWLITGANRGFGLEIARAVLARGDALVATARDTTQLADLVALAPDSVQTLRLDVTDAEQVRAAVDEAAAAGPIDVLVNNAGHGLVGALEELTEEQWNRVLGTNVLGVLAVTRAVLPHMRKQRSGHIVQMSSVGGVTANPGHAAYATSKFALEGMSESLAAEVGPLGIRVTIVEPGPFRTDFHGDSMAYAEPMADYADTPAGATRARFPGQAGNQPGDPVKAAEAIIATVLAESAPLRLPLGANAVDRIRAKLQKQLAELDAVEDLARSADFEPVSR